MKRTLTQLVSLCNARVMHVVTSAVVALSAAAAVPQQAYAQASSATMAPVNDLPNPYRTVEGWAKLPEGRTWGSTSAVDIDTD